MLNLRKFGITATSNELLTLDLLRFVASVAIVFHHSHEFFVIRSERADLASQTWGLALFVDLFFLISGYVITHVYAGKVTSLKTFLRFFQRRIGRLFPLHLLTLILAILMWAVISRFAVANNVPSDDLGCIGLTAILMHGMFPCGNGNYYNGVNWSISAELAMYLVFPLLCQNALKHKHMFLSGALCLLLGMIAWDAFFGTVGNSWENVFPPFRALPTFALGVALRANRELLVKLPRPLLLTAASLIAFISLALIKSSAPPLILLLCITGTCAIATDVQQKAGFLVKAIAPLGQLTYSIYLWHGFFILLFINAIGDKYFSGNWILIILCTIFAYSGILICAYISWRWFETPCRRWIDKFDFGRHVK